MNNKDFALERKLLELDPELHQCFTNTVFAMGRILSNYQLIFPDFTDHTELHSLNIIDFCNQLIGNNIDKLNADEIFVILMGCYFHDTGMGISKGDFDEFCEQIDFKDYFLTHEKDNLPEIVRNFHNEFSGLFLKKYARFFEIPSKQHLFSIIQISRGHRKVDLENENEYPSLVQLDNGNTIALPYLSALVRLADEIDVTAARNSHAIYDLSKITKEVDIIEFMKHEAIKDMKITDDEFILYVSTDDENLFSQLEVIASKMQKTLDYCRRVVDARTEYQIRQARIRIERV